MAVFCGSNFGATDAFADGTRSLGTALARSGITLVYGGTTKGLMASWRMPCWRPAARSMASSPSGCMGAAIRMPA